MKRFYTFVSLVCFTFMLALAGPHMLFADETEPDYEGEVFYEIVTFEFYDNGMCSFNIVRNKQNLTIACEQSAAKTMAEVTGPIDVVYTKDADGERVVDFNLAELSDIQNGNELLAESDTPDTDDTPNIDEDLHSMAFFVGVDEDYCVFSLEGEESGKLYMICQQEDRETLEFDVLYDLYYYEYDGNYNLREAHSDQEYNDTVEASYKGYYRNELSDLNYCTFEDGVSQFSIACSDTVQADFIRNEGQAVLVHYWDHGGDVEYIDHTYDIAGEYDGEAVTSNAPDENALFKGVYVGRKGDMCDFVYYDRDGDYAYASFKCSESVARTMKPDYAFYNVKFTYQNETRVIEQAFFSENLPVLQVSFNGISDEGMCYFKRQDGYEYTMYCKEGLELPKGLINIRYIENMVDDYPIFMRQE